MTDKFEDFENKLFGWISRHNLGIVIIMAPILLWLVMSIGVVSMWGIVGASNVEYMINQTHNGLPIDNTRFVVTNETYDTMETIIIPISILMFNTISYLIGFIGIGYTILVCYAFVRHLYKKDMKK